MAWWRHPGSLTRLTEHSVHVWLEELKPAGLQMACRPLLCSFSGFHCQIPDSPPYWVSAVFLHWQLELLIGLLWPSYCLVKPNASKQMKSFHSSPGVPKSCLNSLTQDWPNLTITSVVLHVLMPSQAEQPVPCFHSSLAFPSLPLLFFLCRMFSSSSLSFLLHHCYTSKAKVQLICWGLPWSRPSSPGFEVTCLIHMLMTLSWYFLGVLFQDPYSSNGSAMCPCACSFC